MDSIKGTDEKYLTVSELNWYVKQKFDRDPYLRQIFLQGELSNFRFRRGGHQYFSLKDDKSKINVVMFRGDFDKVKFEPEEGMKVYVTGRLSTYEAQGSYQFYAKSMEPAGLVPCMNALGSCRRSWLKKASLPKSTSALCPFFQIRSLL